MDHSDKLVQELNSNASWICEQIKALKDIPELYDETLQKWEQTCLDIPDQVSRDFLKIAVTGTVKSGKSTFVNSFFGADFLKRGGGVITSVITKVRRGKIPRANLNLKSWDEINLMIRHALSSSCVDYSELYATFDLRNKEHRDRLKQILDNYINDKGSFENHGKPEMVLFRQVLDNYEFCKKTIHTDGTLMQFKNQDFLKHQIYTGDPSKGFLINDALLEINSGSIDKCIEIADCQGIDSTDITQLSKVLEYLESSNMIIYLISSRTGLREADMGFLSMICQTGLGNNLIFIVNIDLNEHETPGDLANIENSIRNDIAIFKKDPSLYSFSCLYNLLKQIKPGLCSKENKLIELFESNGAQVDYSNGMTGKFLTDFDNLIYKDRKSYIFSNPLHRLEVVLESLQKRVKMFLDIHQNDKALADNGLADFLDMQHNFDKIQTLIKNSMAGIEKSLNNFKTRKIDNFFNHDKGLIFKKTDMFINNFSIDFKRFGNQDIVSGFPRALYLALQDFKSELDRFLVEKINPELIRFTREMDKKTQVQAVNLYQSYMINIFDVYKMPGSALEKFSHTESKIENLIDMTSLKKNLGLKPPDKVSITRYNARTKLTAVTGFGAWSLMSIVMRKLKKKVFFQESFLFKKIISRFKKEIFRSIKITIFSYRDMLVKEYFNVLIKALSEEINSLMLNQLTACSLEIDRTRSIMEKEKSEKERDIKILQSIHEQIEARIKKML